MFYGFSSMQDYTTLDVGLTDTEIQVWRSRHDANVVHMDLEGLELPADLRCHEPKVPS